MQAVSELMAQPIGQIMREAGLINQGQIQVALMEQEIYSHLRFGEILALHGWITQKTADFFAEDLINLSKRPQPIKIGDYLSQADLLTKKDINDILDEQFELGIKFGSMAVLKGCIKQETLEFFLKYFVGQKTEIDDSHFQNPISAIDMDKTEIIYFEEFEPAPTLRNSSTLKKSSTLKSSSNSSAFQSNGYCINDFTFYHA